MRVVRNTMIQTSLTAVVIIRLSTVVICIFSYVKLIKQRVFFFLFFLQFQLHSWCVFYHQFSITPLCYFPFSQTFLPPAKLYFCLHYFIPLSFATSETLLILSHHFWQILPFRSHFFIFLYPHTSCHSKSGEIRDAVMSS